MKHHITAVIILASILPIDISCVGNAWPQEVYPNITRYGSWSLQDERDQPKTRLSGLFRPVSYLLSLRNGDLTKNYRFQLSCIKGVIRAEIDISNISDTHQISGLAAINDITIDAASGRTTFSDSSTEGATVHNGFIEGEMNKSMLDYLKQRTQIDISISYRGYTETNVIPADDTSEAISVLTSLCRQVVS